MDSYSNTRNFDDYPKGLSVQELLQFIIYGSAALICGIINLIALGYIISLKSRNRIETMFLHLFISNFFITFITTPLQVAWGAVLHRTNFFPHELCQMRGFFDTFGIYLPCFIYICIAIDSTRYLSESKSISRIDTTGKIMIFIAWTLAIILSVPEIFLNHARYFSRNYKVCTHELNSDVLYNTVLMIIVFLIPSLTMFICYIINYNKMKKSSQSAIANFQTRIASIDRIERTKIFKMLIIMGIIFFVSWLPFNIITALEHSFFARMDFKWIIASMIFAFTFVWLNPIISFYFIYQNRKNKNVIPSI